MIGHCAKLAAYALGLIPFALLVWGAVNNTLGVDPVKAIEHRLGEVGLQLLVAGLAITPLMKIFRINLVKFRRVLGVLAFFYVTMHLVTWAVLDMGLLWDEILKDLVKRWYIIIGMAAFVLMIPLALTSNDWALRKVGPVRWRALHKERPLTKLQRNGSGKSVLPSASLTSDLPNHNSLVYPPAHQL